MSLSIFSHGLFTSCLENGSWRVACKLWMRRQQLADCLDILHSEHRRTLWLDKWTRRLYVCGTVALDRLIRVSDSILLLTNCGPNVYAFVPRRLTLKTVIVSKN